MSLTLLPKDSYLAMIRNSVGSNLFRILYAEVDGEKQDILQDGGRSCGFFVSSILFHFGWIESPHATVAGLEKDLLESGWQKANAPQIGDVIIWEPKLQETGVHTHAGFYIGDDVVISHSDKSRSPAEHHITSGTDAEGNPVRKVVAIYRRS